MRPPQVLTKGHSHFLVVIPTGFRFQKLFDRFFLENRTCEEVPLHKSNSEILVFLSLVP